MEDLKSLAHLLVIKLREGDEKAFERIYSAYYPKVLFYARHYLMDIEASKEVAQDVFLTVWQKREELDPSLDLQPYILTITRNRCLSVLRKRLVERNYQNKMLGKEEMANYMALCHQSAEKILTAELESLIVKVMDEFPESTKQVFSMSRSENMTYDQIAEKLDVSVGTVEYRMMKALRLFRQHLKDYLPLAIGVMLALLYAIK